MRNFRFDTGFITGFDAGNNRTGNYLLNLLLGNRQLLSNIRACSNECIHKFCRVSLASPCLAEKKYERTLLAGYCRVKTALFLDIIMIDFLYANFCTFYILCITTVQSSNGLLIEIFDCLFIVLKIPVGLFKNFFSLVLLIESFHEFLYFHYFSSQYYPGDVLARQYGLRRRELQLPNE